MDQNEELANSVSKRLSEVEKRRSHIVKVSHAIAVAVVIPCVFAIMSPFIFPGSKVAEVFSNLGLALLSAVLVYKFIELWVDKEYRELRIQEFRSTLLHKDSIANILKEGAVEDILEACLRILFNDNNVASGVRGLLKRFSSELPLSTYSHWESITLSAFNEKYYKLKRVVSFKKSRIPSTITFRCKFASSCEDDRSIVLDRTKEESWVFLSHPSDTSLPSDAYVVSQVRIDEKIIEPVNSETRTSDHEIEYIFRIPDEYAGRKELHKIKFEMEVLQSKSGGFYSFVNSGPTKGVHLSFRSEIRQKIHVVAEGVSCINEPDIVPHENGYELSIDDWVFPNSVVVVAWSEIS